VTAEHVAAARRYLASGAVAWGGYRDQAAEDSSSSTGLTLPRGRRVAPDLAIERQPGVFVRMGWRWEARRLQVMSQSTESADGLTR
jgi:hypothetical protein